MAKEIGKLSAIAASKVKEKGFYPDGAGLYLRVSATGSKSWIFRFMLHGKAREMGLGAFHSVPLADARTKAAECRKLLSEGIDPIKARDIAQNKTKLEEAKSITFKECAENYIKAHKPSWRNAKHAWQWENTLNRFVYPVFGNLSVQDVDVSLVTKVLEPIWTTKTETASRIRGRIEVIIDWATARGFRQGENPARWRGHLENLLPERSKIQTVTHQPALPYEDISEFMALLKDDKCTASLALQFTILTACRTSEVINSSWREIDLQKKIWIVPAERTKMRREHRVPLSEPALQILKEIKSQQHIMGIKEPKWVFVGIKPHNPLSNMAMLKLLNRMKRDDITVHGFRSSFRDWAAEQTSYAREVAEKALAHATNSKVEAAYQRGDLFEKRAQLMNAWAKYCYMPKVKGKVIKMRAK